MTTSQSDSSGGPTSQAVRLLFEYDGDQVRLLDQRPVDVDITDYGLPADTATGNYVDVLGAKDELLARVPIRAVMDTSVEIFPEDHTQSITRINVPPRRGAFTVIVPAAPQAHQVAVVTMTGRTIQPITELGRFQLRIERQ